MTKPVDVAALERRIEELEREIDRILDNLKDLTNTVSDIRMDCFYGYDD